MMTPQKIEEFANNEVVNMYTKLSQDLTNEIIKSIKNTGDISSYTKHQMKVLIKNGGKYIFSKALLQTQKLTNKRKKEINILFEDLVNEEYKGYDKIYERQGKDFIISEEAIQITNGIKTLTNNELKNMTRTIAFSTQKQYVSAMDELYKKVISGGWSYDKAIKSTLIDLSNNGIKLKTKTGNYSLESAVKMNLFTSLKQTVDGLAYRLQKELDLEYVWSPPTPYCRPSHRVINGVVMHKDKFEEYRYLTEEPNCYHTISPVDKEFIPPYTESELKSINKNADKVYENRQKQNYYARQVRNKKKEVVNAKSTPDIQQEKKKQLRNAQAKYRSFSKSVGLDVDYSQTWEAGYNGNRNR